ncbi:MAG TPA: protein-disulfide reductase DsbD domain-containing protein [Terriglobales bacterium]
MKPQLRFSIASIAFALLVLSCAAQEVATQKGPTVRLAPPALTSITQGKSMPVELQFRVENGFHINSNQPSEKYLIPTALTLDPPTDLVVGGTTYPPGKEAAFAFAPDEKLSVYTGDFTVTTNVRAMTSVLPGKYEIRGRLKYQACDNAQCYPPKTLPIQFEVKVVKPTVIKKNPAQSPHEHPPTSQ